MATKKTTNNRDSKKKMSLGIGLTAAAVSAAGAYFLYGSKKATQNRKKVKGWVLKAKGEVLEALEGAQSITEEEFGTLVNAAAGAYATAKRATAGEVKDFKREMRNHWDELQRSNVVKKLTSTKKTPQKKAAKKTAKKAPKKSSAN